MNIATKRALGKGGCGVVKGLHLPSQLPPEGPVDHWSTRMGDDVIGPIRKNGSSDEVIFFSGL